MITAERLLAERLLMAEELRALLSYGQADGVFTWLVKPGKRARAIAGNLYRGYRRIKIGPRFYAAHRLAWLWMTGEWPAAEIDHINMDRDDNRWCNLREASHSQNQTPSEQSLWFQGRKLAQTPAQMDREDPDQRQTQEFRLL
jgi:hypothetical protein